MKKLVKIILIVLLLAFVAIQFMRPERANPAIDEKQTLETVEAVPGEVRSILKRSCKDCHSNETNFPWYSNVAPISWSVVSHVAVGREELNFSKWGTYSDTKKARKLEEMCEEIEEKHMPHNQYLWAHWDSVLSDGQIQTVCDWTKEVRGRYGK